MLLNRSNSAPTLKEVRAAKLKALIVEADSLAGTARHVEQAATEALAEGNDVNLQKQMAFMTGALARMLKDWGAIEYLQTWRKGR
jgi:hypothetical protein